MQHIKNFCIAGVNIALGVSPKAVLALAVPNPPPDWLLGWMQFSSLAVGILVGVLTAYRLLTNRNNKLTEHDLHIHKTE